MARPIISMTIFVENAKTSDPTINTNAINSTKRRRPILSDKGPLPPAPTIAPKSIDDTTNPSIAPLCKGMSLGI